MRSRSEWADGLIASGLTGVGLFALIAPATLLAIAPPCLITTLTGHHCWGCGITRAIVAAVHGDFAAAWAFNKLFVVVLPLLCVEYLRLLCRVARSMRQALEWRLACR